MNKEGCTGEEGVNDDGVSVCLSACLLDVVVASQKPTGGQSIKGNQSVGTNVTG